jgi:molybdopterin molybdotransferase
MTHTTQPLLSIEEALGRLLSAVSEPLPAEEAALADALGRVLSGPIVSTLDLPPWNNSAMDGYAVHAADTAGASLTAPVRLRVVGEVKAGGSADVAIPPGCAVRIATGAPLPPSADAVVPVESTIDTGQVEADRLAGVEPDLSGRARAVSFRPGETIAESCLVVTAAAPGDNVRQQGDDVRAGAVLLGPGTVLGPAQIALAAAVGRMSVPVYRRPIVGVLATGDELREPGGEIDGSGIPDANGPGLLAACRVAGTEAVDLGIARDSVESVLAALGPAVDRADALIVSGGVSVGPYDVVRNAFEVLGGVDLWRVAIQPGKPFAFGRSKPRNRDGRRTLLFGLPGNPVSTLVTFELFVRPVLQRLGGRRSIAPLMDRAVTVDTLLSSQGRRGFVRVKFERDADGAPRRDERGRLRASLAGGQGSHMLSVMAVAEGLAVVPEGSGRLDPGDEVEIRWLDR